MGCTLPCLATSPSAPHCTFWANWHAVCMHHHFICGRMMAGDVPPPNHRSPIHVCLLRPGMHGGDTARVLSGLRSATKQLVIDRGDSLLVAAACYCCAAACVCCCYVLLLRVCCCCVLLLQLCCRCARGLLLLLCDDSELCWLSTTRRRFFFSETSFVFQMYPHTTRSEPSSCLSGRSDTEADAQPRHQVCILLLNPFMHAREVGFGVVPHRPKGVAVVTKTVGIAPAQKFI